MRHFIVMACSLLLAGVFNACSKDDDYQTAEVNIQLAYPEGVNTAEGVTVSLRSTANSSTFEAKTDASGKAVFNVPSGIYEASASDVRQEGLESVIYGGINSQVTATLNTVNTATVTLTASKSSALVIKELYVGGCPDDIGSDKGFARDQSVVLYNNSSSVIDLSDLAFAMVLPYNGTGSNKDYENGKLTYETAGWIPAGMAV